MNITVYAASSGQVPEVYTKAAARLGEILAERGHTLINGAGRTGLMGATIDACLAKGGKAVGVIPQFMIDESWQHKGMTDLIVTPNMHERKTLMAERADACIACPGGVGTSKSSRGNSWDCFSNPLSCSTQRDISTLFWHSWSVA